VCSELIHLALTRHPDAVRQGAQEAADRETLLLDRRFLVNPGL
jgi:hypothetical protein